MRDEKMATYDIVTGNCNVAQYRAPVWLYHSRYDTNYKLYFSPNFTLSGANTWSAVRCHIHFDPGFLFWRVKEKTHFLCVAWSHSNFCHVFAFSVGCFAAVCVVYAFIPHAGFDRHRHLSVPPHMGGCG